MKTIYQLSNSNQLERETMQPISLFTIIKLPNQGLPHQWQNSNGNHNVIVTRSKHAQIHSIAIVIMNLCARWLDSFLNLIWIWVGFVEAHVHRAWNSVYWKSCHISGKNYNFISPGDQMEHENRSAYAKCFGMNSEGFVVAGKLVLNAICCWFVFLLTFTLIAYVWCSGYCIYSALGVLCAHYSVHSANTHLNFCCFSIKIAARSTWTMQCIVCL